MTTLEDRKLRALDLIPNTYLISSTMNKTFVYLICKKSISKFYF